MLPVRKLIGYVISQYDPCSLLETEVGIFGNDKEIVSNVWSFFW